MNPGGVLPALAVLLPVTGFAPAHADRVAKPVCKIIRVADAAFLQQCDRQLRSFALSMPGTERTPVREHTNKFKFTCRPGFCQDEPEVTGWFVNPEIWKRSKRDEPAIFDLYADLVGQKLLRSEQHFRSIFKPSCKLSAVTLAGLPGEMICYAMKSADAALSTVVMVAADDEVGLVLSFHGPDLRNVQDYAVSALRRFSLERGRGDATLERWLQE
jgi:hypothetical protein